MRWEQGRATIDTMLTRGELERVQPKVAEIFNLAKRVMGEMSPF